MGARRQAREIALQALYQCDTLIDWSDEGLSLFFESFKADELAGDERFLGSLGLLTTTKDEANAPVEDELSESVAVDFAKILIDGVRAHLSSIDAAITVASRNWTVSRMARVDRNILRIGTFEINYLSDVPPNVSINEAIEIAKRFGTDDSPMFINGVLDRVACDFRVSGSQPVVEFKKVSNN